MKKCTLHMIVNGEKVSIEVSPNSTLLDVLRDKLNLMEVKEGCGQGDCGACTVILDGKAVNSCLTLAMQAEGKEVTTLSGLNKSRKIHPLQKSFISHGAIQCGFCTPGMIMSAKALLDKNPHPTREEIKVAISGNLCRCTGYKKIVEAIEAVARGKEEKGGEDVTA
ncbi:MAG: (2Fe-2S)-binding protein [Candidatus Aerophobetes bacterium]|nr:(2Fe-2S)-binding protein [Candidatus Aerophobetes bacterium]